MLLLFRCRLLRGAWDYFGLMSEPLRDFSEVACDY
jgi:hypothetical protein